MSGAHQGVWSEASGPMSRFALIHISGRVGGVVWLATCIDPRMRRVACVLALWIGAVPSVAQEAADGASEPAGVELASGSKGWLPEPTPILRAALFMDRQLIGREAAEGFGVSFGDMVPGAGWLAAGPRYRRQYAHDHVTIDASAAFSSRAYKTAQARIELPRLLRSRLSLGSQMRWDDSTQVSYFGEGSATREGERSEYRIRGGALSGYATLRPLAWLDIRAGAGWLAPSLLRRSGPFTRDVPDARDRFPDNIVYSVSEQPTFARRELAITADSRDFPGHPTRGGVIRAAVSQYSDRVSGLFSHTRYEGDVAHFVPLADRRVVVGVRGRLVATAARAGNFVPLYFQPSLGGDQSLRAYSDYRFHDRHMLIVNAEARFALMTHLDVAVFVDAGNVAPRLRALDVNKRSVGAGLRLHTRRQTFARVDVARGGDGWRVAVGMTEPFDFHRRTGWAAAMPFVP